ncbi:alpha/beta hydrolase family protein [Flavobacterium orientale]|uniref:Acylaminoacyl-peptidase n=1 Tax=Flavobacterium orientale TaxID=1756020 RepID=A0A917DF74_9FLAO|nr:prolyl oligopeptidase family serine peptidase [Flavobacterium orientale]GGD35337.1 acylaminoacyl-peptidase [Flavobacterium orientale]
MDNLSKLLLLILLFSNLENGFTQTKKHLDVDDYESWYHFYDYHLSTSGEWVSYMIQNPIGSDTLVLQKTDTDLKRTFLGGRQARFSPLEDRFFYLDNEGLYYQDLISGKLDFLQGLTHYKFSKDGTYLLAENSRRENELQLIHLSTKEVTIVPNVLEYMLSPDGTEVAVLQKTPDMDLITTIKLGERLAKYEIVKSAEDLSNLTWNWNCNGLAFFESLPKNDEDIPNFELCYVHFQNRKKPTFLRTSKVKNLSDDGFIVPESRLFFSQDDKQLFFDVQHPKTDNLAAKHVVVWSWASDVLPPQNEENLLNHYLMCWHIKTNEFMLVNDADHPIGIPTSNGEHALIINPSEYLPYFEYNGIYVDLYVKNLHTGRKKLLAKKIYHQKNHIQVSPAGKYITWYADKNWYIYHFDQDRINCLTCSITTSFEEDGHDYPGEKFPVDKPYWTQGDKFVLLTDSHDIWLISPNGKSKKKITNGKYIKSKFSIYDEGFYSSLRDHFMEYTTSALDPLNGIVLKEVNTENLKEGFSLYQSNRELKKVLFTDDKITSIRHAGDNYMYVLSDFDKSPQLVIQKTNQEKGNVIQRSNEHQKDYYWGKSDLISYTVDGVALKAALFYPADYFPEKSYPMIVKVYQKLSSDLRNYVAPSLTNSTGFNKTNLTLNGYFVLYPDITYTINKTGESALKCVQVAVDKAIMAASVDEDNIGLFGHSFGGFEVSYIITQTHRFKTAIAGAGWHDLVSTFLGTDDFDISSMWRFDTQQLRITAPYYSDDFFNNSPIMHAKSVETPLLLWAGTSDSRINWENSSKMQMALWRLRKKSTFLVYPNEQHFMVDKKNRIDLNLKTLEWFNYYLKGADKPNWID